MSELGQSLVRLQICNLDCRRPMRQSCKSRKYGGLMVVGAELWNHMG